MSQFPNPALVRRVQEMILQTFEISEQRAESYAMGLVALAEGWGSSKTAPNLDWPYIIRKRLGETEKLPWRSEAERLSFETRRSQTFEAYEAYIRGQHQ